MKLKKLKDAVVSNRLDYSKFAKGVYKKTSQKTKMGLGILLASTLAVGATAGSFDDHKEKGGDCKTHYNVEFEAKVSKVPVGYEGEWNIGDKKVLVDSKTILEFEEDGFKNGDEVEVYGIREGNIIRAVKIEQEDNWF